MAQKKNDRFNFEKLTPILLFLTIVLAFTVGILWQKVQNLEKGSSKTTAVVKQTNPPRPAAKGKLTKEQAEKLVKVSDQDHIRGLRDAKVFLIEYSDLECPYCKRFHKTAQRVVDEYEGQVAWVYRHFPLDVIHSKARTEAIAAECAGEQGGNEGFWALIDKIFEVTPSNNGLNLDELPDLAEQVGLDGKQLKQCIDSGKYKDHVEEDYQGGAKAGVTGTPANFIVNEKGEVWFVPGALPFEQLKPIIDEALGR